MNYLNKIKINKTRLTSPLFFAFMFIVFILPFPASGQIIPNLGTAKDNLSESANQLIRARDNIGDDLSEESASYRKKVVENAIILALQEISDTREKLNSITKEEIAARKNLETIKNGILKWLDSEEKYFNEAQKRLDKDLTLQEIINIAKEIKSHREKSYNDNLTNALNFIFTFETLRIVNTASERWNRINADIQRIERAGIVRRGFFSSEMNESRKMIDGARSLAERAFEMIENIYIVPTEAAGNEEYQNKEDPLVVKNLPNSRDLCEAAIVKLRSAYGEFIKISLSLRRILRLPPQR